MEPWFNEVPRDWGNWFVISRVCYIEVLFIHYAIAGLKNNCSLYQGLRYMEVH